MLSGRRGDDRSDQACAERGDRGYLHAARQGGRLHRTALRPRRQAEQWVRAVGGRVAKDVNFRTDVLVRGEQSPIYIAGDRGKKLLDAIRVQDRGGKLKIINERQFRRLISSASGTASASGRALRGEQP